MNKLTIILLTSLLLCACNTSPELQKVAGYAQGTTYHISFWHTPAVDAPAVKQNIDAELNRIDAALSNYRPDSAIEQFNATISNESQTVSEELVGLVEKARAVSVASDGCYDVTIKPLFELWGFTKDQLHIPDEKTLQVTLQQVGFKQLETVDATHLRKANPQLRVDISSIGQGYSVQRVAQLLEQQGIANYLVEIGGELQTRGKKPDGSSWRVALEKPLSGERTMQKVLTINQAEPLAVMTSGTYRHFFDANGKRYSHILNAHTGRPVEHSTVSVTVLHSNSTQADAWSTALLCLGQQAGLAAANKAGIAALFIEQQGDAFNEERSDALKNLNQVVIK